jgi:hypothetical protein
MKLNELTEEQQAKLKSCRDSKELMSALGEMGIELTDEQLDAVAGGKEWYKCDRFTIPIMDE